MTVARVTLQPAYVVHTRAFRDTSLIVEVFTPEYGRMSLLARGAKSGKAKKSLILQPFRALHVSWAGRSELPVLSAVEEAGNSLRLQGEALACGYYVNELIYFLVPRFEPSTNLFAEYWPVIESLTTVERREEALRTFEVTLLEQIGYAPQIAHDIESGLPIEPGKNYRYRIPEGPVQVENTDKSGIAIGGHALLDLQRQAYAHPATSREIRFLMRSLIHYHLDGRELISRTLFSSFRKIDSGVR
ncbi:DNA repair protein RecO [Chromatiales bacterium (ex Bugula neritina AB1)]|nr:DNA repair protein RecO [Chromatiales bacterium (ex Bugula neritina AB1)]